MPGFNIGEKSNGAQINSKVDYYYTYTWEIFELFNETYTDTADSNNPVIMLRDMTLPTFSAGVDKYLGASVEYKYAKSVSWDDVKLTWYDTDGMIDVIEKWRKSVWSDEEGLRPGVSYKKSSQLDHFLPDYTKRVSWVLYNSWPSQIRSGELTYTNSDIKIVEATICYDWASAQSRGLLVQRVNRLN